MKDVSSIRVVFYRENMIRKFLQSLLILLSSYPALLIEIFTRRKFGERYLPLSSCLTAIAILLFVFVLADDFVNPFIRGYGSNRYANDFEWNKLPVIVFAIAALIQSIRHKRESVTDGKTVDFNRFSRSAGLSYAYWYKLESILPKGLYNRLPITERNLRRYYEPLSAVMIGIVLLPLPFTRLLGIILIICGFFYYQRARIQYLWAYDFILNDIE